MPPSLSDLIGVVADRSGDSSQLDRLGAAVEMSEHLSTLGDELVGHFVEAARRDGCSWAQIGQQLGVTRQAAQQRFVDAGRRGLERLGTEARWVVDLAQREATRLGHNYLGTEHLLLGLLAEGEGVAARVLDAVGVSAKAVRRSVEDIIGRGSSVRGGPIPLTPRAKKVLDLAVREARAMGDEEVATEHLLLGLVREGEGVAAQVLADLGVDFPDVPAQVTALTGRTCARPARRRRRRAR
jgi:hypothetical protein